MGTAASVSSDEVDAVALPDAAPSLPQFRHTDICIDGEIARGSEGVVFAAQVAVDQVDGTRLWIPDVCLKVRSQLQPHACTPSDTEMNMLLLWLL